MTHNLHAPYLFEGSHGRVLHCACCGRMQIDFGGLTLLLSRPCYGRLWREVAQTAGRIRRGEDGGWFRLVVDTDAGEVTVPLRAGGVTQFHQLLRGARAMLNLEDRLQTIAAGPSQKPICS